MKKPKFTEEQIAFALRQVASATWVAEVCWKMGIAEQTVFRWKKKYRGLAVLPGIIQVFASLKGNCNEEKS
jgi:putative transposase